MTQRQCLDILHELAALERLAAVLAQPDPSPEWQYVRPLIENRLHWLRVSLSQVDPVLIQSCEHLRAAGVLWPAEVGRVHVTDPSEAAELPPQMSERPATRTLVH